MHRVLGLMVVAAVVALPAGAARADYPTDAPIVTTDKATYEVNEAVIAVGVNYRPGEPVVFSITGEFAGPATQSVRAAAASSRVLGPATADARGTATLTFAAPDAPGAFTVTGTQGALIASVTIAVTSTAGVGAGAPTTPPTTTPPTTTPTATPTTPAAGLPSTGGNTSISVRIGAILILLGLGLALMAAQRQRARAGR